MDRTSEINSIRDYPESYLSVQGKSLEKRLADLEFTENEHKKVITDSNIKQTKGVGKELLKAVLPPLSVALEIIDWNKKVDDDLKESKKSILLTKYFDKVDSNEKAIKDLIETMSNLYGNTLVNKIFQMLDDFPPDGDLMRHLVSSLKKICQSKKFEELFEDHKFNLGLIESLSPQALSFIADKNTWPIFTFQFTGMSVGNKIDSQYQKPFIESYFNKKGIHDKLKTQRGVYIVNELQRDGFIQCYSLDQNRFMVQLTELGNELYQYLS